MSYEVTVGPYALRSDADRSAAAMCRGGSRHPGRVAVVRSSPDGRGWLVDITDRPTTGGLASGASPSAGGEARPTPEEYAENSAIIEELVALKWADG